VNVTFQAVAAPPGDTLLDLMREFYATEGLPYDRGVVRDALGPLLSRGPWGRVWTLHQEGAAIGYVALTLGYSLELGGVVAIVDELYIRPAYRWRGAGRRALDHVADAARDLGARALLLEVSRTNAGAQALYREAGFQDTGRSVLTRRL
jgi:ribosomal protein S18 acetylase RimI-like enzyme